MSGEPKKELQKAALPPGKKRRRRLFALLTTTAVLLVSSLTIYLFRQPILIEFAHVLTVDDSLVQSDYIIVLGGDQNSRPFLAADLFKKGLAPKVLLFEAKTDRLIDAGFAMREDQVYQKVLDTEGVPRSAVVLVPGVVDSTEDEAASLAKFLAGKPLTRLIIVTSAEHTRRARWVFKKSLKDDAVEMRMAAARNPLYDETNWWREDPGTISIVHEYLKFPFYYCRYAW